MVEWRKSFFFGLLGCRVFTAGHSLKTASSSEDLQELLLLVREGFFALDLVLQFH